MKKAVAVLMILVLLLTAGCRRKAAEAPAEVPEAAAASQPAPTAQAQPASPENAPTEPIEYAFTFSAQTLDGETVTEEYFSRYDLVMVNVWASWCGPCQSELGDLAELYGTLPENVGFLSVTVDYPDDLKDAKALLSENGCAFPCLDGQGSEGLTNGPLRRVIYIPTTLFLDRHGNQVGDEIVGVPQGNGSVSDAYMTEIRARLATLGK